MAIAYDDITNATLSVVLAELETREIGIQRIVGIEHDGSAWHAIYTTQS